MTAQATTTMATDAQIRSATDLVGRLLENREWKRRIHLWPEMTRDDMSVEIEALREAYAQDWRAQDARRPALSADDRAVLDETWS